MAAKLIFRGKFLVFYLLLAMSLYFHEARLCHAEMHKGSSKLITLVMGRSVEL